MVGIVMLIGIVKKNAIMMIDLPWTPREIKGKTLLMRFMKVASSDSVPS